ncbi:MAG: sporulation integral membrane protein YlbJ [Syntrophomonadaceae bacterium]|nr:sporulation integral membrane protein YlbJ [Syntrophomonadaceae bacterium]
MKPWPAMLGAFLAVALAIFMIVEPAATLEASTTGLKLWFNAVLPALFPFFVVCDLMVALGVVHFMGVILEPVMRPVFRLPGAAGFVVAMGFTSGFPVGAVLTRQLYEQGSLSNHEAERLASFTNNASPLFIIGVVGTGLLHNPVVGYLLAAAHYLSNLLVGFLIGRKAPQSPGGYRVRGNLLSLGLAELLRANRQSKGPGHMLGESIKKALLNTAMVGGFIIIFSVLSAALSRWGVIFELAGVFRFLGASYATAIGLGLGCFEMTIGAQAIAASTAPELEKLLAVSGVLAWSGLSVQAQVMSLVAGTPVRYWFYMKTRLLQILLSLGLTLIGFTLWPANLPLLAAPTSPLFSSMPVAVDFLRASCQGIMWSTAVLLMICLISWLSSIRFSGSIR